MKDAREEQLVRGQTGRMLITLPSGIAILLIGQIALSPLPPGLSRRSDFLDTGGHCNFDHVGFRCGRNVSGWSSGKFAVRGSETKIPIGITNCFVRVA